MWSCWVSDLLDTSEPSARVFLFDNILLLVVPTAAICLSKGMIPLETVKRDMTTLGIITKSLLVPTVQVPKIGARSEHVACLFKLYHAYNLNEVYTFCCMIICGYCHAVHSRIVPFAYASHTLENQRTVRVTFFNTYVRHFATPRC